MTKSEAEHATDVEAQLDGLKHKSTRMEAVATLSEVGTLEAVEPLLAVCKRTKRAERSAIDEALARIGTRGPPEQVVASLIEHGLESSSATIQACAARALGLMGESARSAYQALCNLACPKKADGAHPADRVHPADIEHPKDDSAPSSVRLAAIGALGAIGDLRAVEPLVACLREPDRDVRKGAAKALGALGAGAMEGVGADVVISAAFAPGNPLDVRIAAADAMGRIGGQSARETLCRAFRDADEPTELRVAVLAALERTLGNEVIPLVAEALEDEDKNLRRQAVRGLADLETPDATSRLALLYEDGDKKVRKLALRELQQRYKQLLERVADGELALLPGLLAARRAMAKEQADAAAEISQRLVELGRHIVPALCVLTDLDRPNVDIVRILEMMGPEASDAYDTLVAQLDNPDIPTCCAAARALGVLGDERAIPVLAERLSFDRELLKLKKGKKARKRALALQQAAATGLGRLGKSALIVALGAARSADPVLRRGGVIALGRIGGGRALAALDKAVSAPEPLVREAAAEAMERAAAKDVARLGKLLENDDDRVRAKAVKALGKLDDLRSLDLLLRAYGDPSERVNKAVVKAMARREGERAYSILIAAAGGGNISALHALEKQPIPQAVPALAEALDSPWYDVYYAALRATQAHVADIISSAAFQGDQQVMASLRQLIPELSYLLHDDSTRIRRLALGTLGMFQEPETVEDIAFMLTDPKEDIRYQAVQILESIGDERAQKALAAYLKRERQNGLEEDEDLSTEVEEAIARMAEATSAAIAPSETA